MMGLLRRLLRRNAPAIYDAPSLEEPWRDPYLDELEREASAWELRRRMVQLEALGRALDGPRQPLDAVADWAAIVGEETGSTVVDRPEPNGRSE